MNKEAILVKAFTKDLEQGNPAGVILDADDLTDQQMIGIAAELGFSESAFIQTSSKADFKVRFFTPKQEVPLCGHATIGAFHVLHERELVQLSESTQETGAGILKVNIAEDGMVIMEQGEPKFWDVKTDRKKIARLLNLNETDLMDYPIESISTGGVPKLIIPIKTLSLLHSIKPDLEGITAYDRSNSNRGFYPFTPETLEEDSDFYSRQFNPSIGINEDPITGVAAGPLGCYVQKYGLTNKKQLIIEQGFIMNKGGKMYVNLEDGVKVGGYGVIFGEKEVLK